MTAKYEVLLAPIQKRRLTDPIIRYTAGHAFAIIPVVLFHPVLDLSSKPFAMTPDPFTSTDLHHEDKELSLHALIPICIKS